MLIIKLTSAIDSQPIYINTAHIGHVYSTNIEGQVVTIVGVITHNNGGFRVHQTPDEILRMMIAKVRTQS
jgi:hypothetical protein